MSLLADFILFVHFAFVLFVVGGLGVIWFGMATGWKWVRNFWFRALHLIAIGFVTIEALLGVVCPLTLWEDALRGGLTDRSFVARWVHRMLFYNFPEWVFTVIYVAFALVVVITYWVIPPYPRHQAGRRQPDVTT